MENYLAVFTLIGSILALIFAGGKASKVLRADEGTEKMKKISADGVIENEIVIDSPKPRTADFNLTDEFLSYKRKIVEILHLL